MGRKDRVLSSSSSLKIDNRSVCWERKRLDTEATSSSSSRERLGMILRKQSEDVDWEGARMFPLILLSGTWRIGDKVIFSDCACSSFPIKQLRVVDSGPFELKLL